MYSFHVLLDCNLFEMNISYGFGNIESNEFTMPTAFGAVDRNLKSGNSTPLSIHTCS